MPELPEVETLKLGLQKYLVGHKILDIEVKVSKIFQGNKRDIVGAKVNDIKRVGKGLIMELNNDYILAVHLKLTGQLVFQDKKKENLALSPKTGGSLPSKFTCVIFKLDQGASLFYNDLRRFGWIKVIKKDKVFDLSFFKEMGPEIPISKIKPFDSAQGKSQRSKTQGILTLDKFKDIAAKSNQPVKIVLMDQKKIGGIGNIYANEALFEAEVDPRRKAKSLSEKEVKKLYEAIIDVLEKGLKYGGASDVNFVNALGQDGQFQEHFKVYRRTGEKCINCSGTIKRITLGGRGTFICENCQK